MAPRAERLLRWVWLINGVLLLGVLVVALLFVSGQWILDLTTSGEPLSVSSDRAEDARPAEPLRYGAPRPIRGTATRIVLIHRGPGPRITAPLSPGSYDAAGGSGAPVVNVAFVDEDGGRLLLDRPAYVAAVRWPGEGAGDSRLSRVVYEMAVEDGNGDGWIDHRDPRTLYVSAADGTGLRRVLPAGHLLRSWEVLDDGTVFVAALREQGRGAGDDGLSPRAFLVGADGRARPYAALDSLAAAAGEALR